MYESSSSRPFTGDGSANAGPLAGIRVVDGTTWLGAYAGRLLADLGADVVRLEPSDGSAERWQGPRLPGGTSAWWAFVEAGKRGTVLDAQEPGYADRLARLLDDAQVLLTSEGPAALRDGGLDPEHLRARHPGLVHVSVSPYGLDGPYADRPATDLTLLAAGGLLSLAGDPDREPVRPFGTQTALIASLHATVGALIAVLVREESGRGQTVDVSAQEAVAHSLENAVQYADLEGVVRHRVGSAPTEAGTGLFTCRDGWVYMVCGLGGYPLGWDGLISWLDAEGVAGADRLRAPQWQEAVWRKSVEAVAEFRVIFEGFAADRGKQELYEAGQRFGVSIAPVCTPDDLLASPQLTERGFFREIDVDGVSVVFPGAPYRFAGAEVGPQGGPPPAP
ncbi:CaiB/BaiF CoA transferase family protein [Amycolatopsis thermoflava]